MLTENGIEAVEVALPHGYWATIHVQREGGLWRMGFEWGTGDGRGCDELDVECSSLWTTSRSHALRLGALKLVHSLRHAACPNRRVIAAVEAFRREVA